MISTVLACFIIAVFAETSLAFLPHTRQLSLSQPPRRHSSTTTQSLPVTAPVERHARALPSFSTTSRGRPGVILRAAADGDPVEITFPTPEAAAAMGIRDWPQQFRSSAWTDAVPEGGIATRYVLNGRGRLAVDYYDGDGELRRIENQRVYPGTLVEVDGEASLQWEVDDENEGMVVLTPNYEEGGKLLLVGGFFLVFCTGLLIGSGGF